MEHHNPQRTKSPHGNHFIAGQNGQPSLQQRAKALRRAMTPEEAILWQHLRRNQLGGFHFRRQQVICGYIVDFFCVTADLAVEVDGDIHQQQVDYDLERDQVLAGLGLRTLRFSNEEVRQDIDLVLEKILSACHSSPKAGGESDDSPLPLYP